MDESHENSRRIWINVLAQYCWHGLCDALGPGYSMRTVLSIPNWLQLALETGSLSQLQLFPHSHTHRHFHTYAHRVMLRQGALSGLSCFVEFLKKTKRPVAFGLGTLI